MSDFKLKTELTHRFGQTLTTSEGEISFDKDGIAEVTEEIYNSADSIHGVEKIVNLAPEKDETPFEFTEESLKTLKIAKLKEIAASAELDVAEYGSLKKDDLVAYLLEKVSE